MITMLTDELKGNH